MGLKKINKIQAKRLYNQGYKIILVGNRVSPHHFYFYLKPELGSEIAFYIRRQ